MSFPPLGKGCSGGGRNESSAPTPCTLHSVHSVVPMETQGARPVARKASWPARAAGTAGRSPQRRESVSWERVRAGVLGKGGEGLATKTQTARQGLEACGWSLASQESAEGPEGHHLLHVPYPTAGVCVWAPWS